MDFGRATKISRWSLLLLVPLLVWVSVASSSAVPTFLGAVALIVVICLAVVATARSGELVEVSAGAEAIVVRPNGINRLWALRRAVTIPWSAVTEIRVTNARSLPIGMRLPGTSLPGILTAGSYGTGDKRDFWLIGRGHEALVFDLHDHEYRRVVLELPDAPRVAEELRAARPA